MQSSCSGISYGPLTYDGHSNEALQGICREMEKSFASLGIGNDLHHNSSFSDERRI